MGQQRRRHTAAFKAQVAAAALKEQQTLNELASTYGVHPVQVAQWKKQALSGLPELFASRRARAQDDAEALQARLYEEIGRLTTTAVVVNRGGPSAGDSGSIWPAVGGGGATATRPARPAPRTAAPTRAARAAGAPRAPLAAVSRPLELPFFHRRRSRHRQVRLREQRERDVPVPAGPAPHLVVIQPHLALRALEAFLDRPPRPGHAHQLG